jgi:hypothetical protein
MLRVLGRSRFKKGPFNLGAFSIPIATTAVTWILFISIVFILPEENPVNSQTLNYTVVAVGIVISYSLGFWLVSSFLFSPNDSGLTFGKLSARKWFTGPQKQIEGWLYDHGKYHRLIKPRPPAEQKGIDVMDPEQAAKLEADSNEKLPSTESKISAERA